MEGFIKTLVGERGYGFITGEDGQDYFFHHSACPNAATFYDLCEGDRVLFEAKESEKGPRGTPCEGGHLERTTCRPNVELCLSSASLGHERGATDLSVARVNHYIGLIIRISALCWGTEVEDPSAISVA